MLITWLFCCSVERALPVVDEGVGTDANTLLVVGKVFGGGAGSELGEDILI